jgi:hypothetical protein
MATPPANPKLYHTTHVDNLRDIVANGGLLSDATMIAQGGPRQAIGMSGIKRRRIEELDVDRHPGSKVGDYVPFYFCPRSVMLFVIHCVNHPELTYHDGQGPIVHLEAVWEPSSGGRRTPARTGPSPFPTRAPTTRSSGREWMSWINSIGRRLPQQTFARLR